MKDYTQSQADLIERFEELRWSAEAVDEFLDDHFDKSMDMLSKRDCDEAWEILKDEEPIPQEDLPESQFDLEAWLEKVEARREEFDQII